MGTANLNYSSTELPKVQSTFSVRSLDKYLKSLTSSYSTWGSLPALNQVDFSLHLSRTVYFDVDGVLYITYSIDSNQVYVIKLGKFTNSSGKGYYYSSVFTDLFSGESVNLSKVPYIDDEIVDYLDNNFFHNEINFCHLVHKKIAKDILRIKSLVTLN